MSRVRIPSPAPEPPSALRMTSSPCRPGRDGPRVVIAMRRGFNLMNQGMVPLWRLGLGRMMNSWPEDAGQMLVFEHMGRRSGAEYRTPVDFSRAGDDLYCLASAEDASDDAWRLVLHAPSPDGLRLRSPADARQLGRSYRCLRKGGRLVMMGSVEASRRGLPSIVPGVRTSCSSAVATPARWC